MSIELSLMRIIGRCLPPIPHATAVVNRILKPIYLRKPRSVVVAKAWGFSFRLDPAEAIDGGILFYPHLYNRAEFMWLRDVLKPTDFFVDVGAYIGAYALIASRHCRRIAAIEANPEVFRTLTENIRLNGATVETHNVGVSARPSCAVIETVYPLSAYLLLKLLPRRMSSRSTLRAWSTKCLHRTSSDTVRARSSWK